MEYVLYKGKGDILYTVGDHGNELELSAFGGLNGGINIHLPLEPCDLELFRDTLHEVLTEIIEKKRKK